MVPLLIHLPPTSEDVNSSNRDERDLTEEVLSQAQVMYNIISSTATKGFKSKVYGQRHISFEIVAHGGLVHYYAVVPLVLVDVIRQAVAAAYPSARLEEVSDTNIFSKGRQDERNHRRRIHPEKVLCLSNIDLSGVEKRCFQGIIKCFIFGVQRRWNRCAIFTTSGV